MESAPIASTSALPSRRADSSEALNDNGLDHHEVQLDAQSRYSYLNLLPSTRQTTVKTITTTTIHYAPIRLPRPPSPVLSGNYTADRYARPLAVAEEKERRRNFSGRGSQSDKSQFGLQFGHGKDAIRAVHQSDGRDMQTHSEETDRKGKKRMIEEDAYDLNESTLAEAPAEQASARHMFKSNSHGRLCDLERDGPPSKRIKASQHRKHHSTAADTRDRSSLVLVPDARAIITSHDLEKNFSKHVHHPPSENVLPSPLLSPRLDADDNQSDGPQRKDKYFESHHPATYVEQVKEEVQEVDVSPEHSSATELHKVEQVLQQKRLGSGFEMSTLMSLNSLVHHFNTLPSTLQTHVLHSLLRHSSIPTLQSINALIQPALKRDFISDLPTEIAILILQQLGHSDVMHCLEVCKNWYRLINSESRVWKSLLIKENLWVGGLDKTEERECHMYTELSEQGIPLANRKRRGSKTRTKPAPSRLMRELSIPQLLQQESERSYWFTKRWETHIWKEDFDLELESAKTAQDAINAVQGLLDFASSTAKDAHDHLDRSPARPRLLRHPHSRSIAPTPQPRPPVASISPAEPNCTLQGFTHPLKLVYKKRYAVRSHWHSTESMPHYTTFRGQHSSVVTCLQFDNDKIVTASDDPHIDIYDTITGEMKIRLEGHEGGVWALQYIGNVLVSGSTDRTLRVWDMDTGHCSHIFSGHTSTIRCLQIVEPVNVNPDPKGPPVWEPPYPLVVTGSRDWTLRVWRLPSPTRTSSMTPYVPPSPSDENADPTYNPYHLRVLKGHTLAVRALAAHGRTLVSGSYDSTLRVWDMLSGHCKYVLSGHEAKVYSVILDHERKRCASGSMDGTVRLWSTETGEALYKLEGHSSLVGLLGLSHHFLVSAGADSTLKVWDPSNGTCIDTLPANAGHITCFKHDDFRIVSGSEGQLRLWDIRRGRAIRDILENMNGVWQLQFSDRFVVAAVQRNGTTEFEIIDFFPELRHQPPELGSEPDSSSSISPIWQYDEVFVSDDESRTITSGSPEV